MEVVPSEIEDLDFWIEFISDDWKKKKKILVPQRSSNKR